MSNLAALRAQLRAHLAEMIIALCDADDFHYTINPETSPYGFSLCQRLGMTPRDYGTLLAGAYFARIKGGKLIMLQDEWKEFVSGGDFSFIDGTVQFGDTQIRLENYVTNCLHDTAPKRLLRLRIGRDSKQNAVKDLLDQTDRNGKLIETPPKISCLRQGTAASIWK